MQTTIPPAAAGSMNFDTIRDSVRRQFAKIPESTPIFTTDAADLYDLYLAHLPEHERQQHTCTCCKQFIQHYGHLATIDDEGILRSAFWSTTGAGDYGPAVAAMGRAVARAKVTGVFLSRDQDWGTDHAGGFSHFHVQQPRLRNILGTKDLGPRMAQLKQDFGTLSHGLAEYPIETLKQAVLLLKSDSLARAARFLEPALFLYDLQAKIAAMPRSARDNLIWKAVAKAPVGWSTPRSSLIGTLLDDIKAEMEINLIKRRFAEKVDPLQYMRPQAAPSAGNVAAAERLVEQLGIAKSLRRRFARIEDVRLMWTPRPAAQTQPKGVFGHLLGSTAAEPGPVDGGRITWAKFVDKVLPSARRIQMMVPAHGAFCGCLTAMDAEDPPILKWDHEHDRYPVSWYQYAHGSAAQRWGLAANSLVDVTGITQLPKEANESCAVLILQGAKDAQNPGLALFPEILKSDLHQIRATIEAHSKAGKPDGAEHGTANGIFVGHHGCDGSLRVTTEFGVTIYKIDRWN